MTQGGPAHPVGKTPRRPGGQVADGDRINTLAAVGGVVYFDVLPLIIMNILMVPWSSY